MSLFTKGAWKNLFLMVVICIYSSDSVSGVDVADLSLSITHDAVQPVNIGDVFNITITASNGGPDTVGTGVFLSLSDNLDINSSDCIGFIVGNIILWSSGELTNQGSFACNVSVTVNGFGIITITGNIGLSQNIDIDPDLTNNNDTISIGGAVKIIPLLSKKSLAILVTILLLSGFLTIGDFRNRRLGVYHLN